jgi:RHH-type proline utilization regulon transcriptional repressor/proline dehydrogenase/delta 1-pyrroline-5-carboxylate dehydrogenase
VLSVLRADDLEHALDLLNATPYGLTAGLHSLDEREQARFTTRAQCGNLYVNRTITGAIVGRQPFGGHKASSVGPGAKAGGPNYVSELQEILDAPCERLPEPSSPTSLPPAARALLEWSQTRLDAGDVARLRARIHDYQAQIEGHFSLPQPSAAVVGQDNFLLYRPVGPLLLVAGEKAAPLDVVSALAAGLLSGCELHLSLSPAGVGAVASRELVLLGQLARTPTRVEALTDVAARLEREATKYERLRWIAGPDPAPPDALLRAALAIGCHVSIRPVLAHGRYELTFYHREQTISVDYHRYGHLGFRSEGLGDLADADAIVPRVTPASGRRPRA